MPKNAKNKCQKNIYNKKGGDFKMNIKYLENDHSYERDH